MKCPECDSPTTVVDSRKRPEYLYRRRECTECSTRFSTKEVLIDATVKGASSELNRLIRQQAADAKADKLGYKGTSRARNSVRASLSLDYADSTDRDVYNYIPD